MYNLIEHLLSFFYLLNIIAILALANPITYLKRATINDFLKSMYFMLKTQLRTYKRDHKLTTHEPNNPVPNPEAYLGKPQISNKTIGIKRWNPPVGGTICCAL